MSCLYLSDYGPPEPGFDPSADGGWLLKGFEAHAAQLGRAANLAQLEAMERQLQRGQDITWCDQGYGWAYGRPVDAFFAAVVIAVILPYAAWKARNSILGRQREATTQRSDRPRSFASTGK